MRKPSLQASTVQHQSQKLNAWQKYTLGAPAVSKIPEGYVIIEMYTTSRNERHQPNKGRHKPNAITRRDATRRDFFVFKSKQNRQGKEIL